MPRDPDLDVGIIERYLNTAAQGVDSVIPELGSSWGVHVVLEDRAGGRYVGTFDPPEAALEYARDLQREALRAIEQRDGQMAWVKPPPPPRATYLMTASTDERRKALDPQTCAGCGVVEGPAFEPRHHPSDCPALLAHLASLTEPETP